MKNTKIRKQLIGLLLIFSFNALYAQQKINFSGNYLINKSKIDFGKAPDWVLPVRFKVMQENDNLNIVRTTANQAGTETDRTFSFSGNNPIEYTTASGVKNKTTAQWDAEKTKLTIDLHSMTAESTPGQSYTEIWSLIDGGKTLVIDRTVTQANGLKYTIRGFYDRQ